MELKKKIFLCRLQFPHPHPPFFNVNFMDPELWALLCETGEAHFGPSYLNINLAPFLSHCFSFLHSSRM